MSNSQHCGTCGAACSGGRNCVGAACTCPSGLSFCGSTCANLDNDPANCGACGYSCPSGLSCSSGKCVVTCAAGAVSCGGSCVDPMSDSQHCGACGAACGSGRNCVEGACVCPTGLSFCGSTCANLDNDPLNCGACGRSCGAGATCNGGVCSCAPGQALCDGVCRDIQTDPANCGACGTTCSADQTCSSGACACPPGTKSCSGRCVDVSSDSLNCGSCGNVCASDRLCASGSCKTPFTCQSNFTSAPADCLAFPLDLNKCGVEGTPVAETLTETPGGGIIDYPLTSAVNEGFRLSGPAHSSTWPSGHLNFVFKSELFPDVVLDRWNNRLVADATDLSFWRLSSPYACARPGLLQLEADPNAKYQIKLERFLLSGKHNTGGASLATAVPLAVNSGGLACDQVCGRLSSYCATQEDRQQFYRVTLPPRSAAIVEVASRSLTWLSSNFHIDAFQSNETLICRLTYSLSVHADYKSTRGRLVNNTFAPQEVILKIQTDGTLDYNMSIAVEP